MKSIDTIITDLIWYANVYKDTSGEGRKLREQLIEQANLVVKQIRDQQPDLIKATGTEALVCREIAKRQFLGLNKYGTSVSDNPLDLRAWASHARDEALDQAIYLQRIIQEIDRAKTGVIRDCPLVNLDPSTGVVTPVYPQTRS